MGIRMRNIVYEIKTTLIGLLIIAFGVLAFFLEDLQVLSVYVRLGIIAVGILFLFIPDKILRLGFDKLKGLK